MVEIGTDQYVIESVGIKESGDEAVFEIDGESFVADVFNNSVVTYDDTRFTLVMINAEKDESGWFLWGSNIILSIEKIPETI